MKYSKYKSKIGFFAGKGFYIVLAVCIIAVGAAAFTAVSTITSMEESLLSSSERPSSVEAPKSSDTVSTTEQVQKPVSDVPDTREESSKTAPSSSKVSSSEEKVYFKIPLVGNIGKTFSDSALQYSKTYGDMRLHLGVDIQAEKGAEVVSAAKGKVEKIADDSLWGRMVVINHGGGIVVYYCGLENLTVSEGETVKAGTKLGVVGSVPCECEDASHIHIAVLKDGEYISPLELISE